MRAPHTASQVNGVQIDSPLQQENHRILIRGLGLGSSARDPRDFKSLRRSKSRRLTSDGDVLPDDAGTATLRPPAKVTSI